MKKLLISLALIAAVIAGCGSTSTNHTGSTGPTGLKGIGTKHCEVPVGQGTVGVCVPKPANSVKKNLLHLGTTASTIPDISEYQNCATSYVPSLIFRIYEAGTDRTDSAAYCNAASVHRWHIWAGVYSFLRPGNCNYQADRTVAIFRAIGGVNGPIIADAEVPLPEGFVSCWTNRVASDTGNHAQVIYSSPGTWYNGNPNRSVWGATYGSSHGCIGNACSWVAWQFSSEYNCRGYYGDCSLNYGITNIVQTHEESRPEKEAKLHRLEAAREPLHAYIKQIRYLLSTRGCRYHVAHHEHLGPKCTEWFRHGNEANARLRSIQHQVENLRHELGI